MKKIVSISLSIILIFSMLCLSSCNALLEKFGLVEEKPSEISTLAGKTPKELYDFTIDKLNSIKSYTVSMKQITTATSEGQTGQITSNSIIKSDGNNSYIKIESDQVSSNMELWYVNGMCYISMYSQKIKTPISLEEYKESILNSNSSLESLLDLDESDFEGVVFKAQGDYWVLNLSVDGDTFTEIYSALAADVTFKGDIIIRYFFDNDGNLVKVANSFDYVMSGIDMHCESVSTYDLNPVVINPPEDASSYVLNNSII